MPDSETVLTDTRRVVWRAGAGIVALFWLIQMTEIALVDLSEGREMTLRLLAPRVIILIAGIILSIPIVEVAAGRGPASFQRRLATTVSVALIGCAALMAVNYGVYFVSFPRGRLPFNTTEFIYTAIGWSWFFLGLTGAVIGLAYSVEVRDRERRLAAMSEIAKDARLAALRYQLNPHFLFNTLNSIASLVEGGEKREAATMVLSLSDFLRATLELDPLDDVPLSREIELQALYLSIEEARFPDRLSTLYEIEGDVRDVLVPALITQPVIENAIRHAVAKTRRPVTLRVEARRDGSRLRLSISNDGPPGRGPSGGTGVGMANVRARLEGRFGARQRLTAGPSEEGYQVVLEIPLSSADDA